MADISAALPDAAPKIIGNVNKATGALDNLTSHTIGQRSLPFAAGGMLAAPFAMADGAQQAQDQIANQAPQMMQNVLSNLPWQARLKYMMAPTAFNQYLTPELMQQLMSSGRGQVPDWRRNIQM